LKEKKTFRTKKPHFQLIFTATAQLISIGYLFQKRETRASTLNSPDGLFIDKTNMTDPNQKVSPQLQQFIMQEQAKAQVSLFVP
jgi:hypothetical protein